MISTNKSSKANDSVFERFSLVFLNFVNKNHRKVEPIIVAKFNNQSESKIR